MTHSFSRVLTLIFLSCSALCAYSQCCAVKEKTGMRDRYLYDQDVILLDVYTDTKNDWLQYIDNYNQPQVWDQNKFIRVRAWSDRSSNTDNYIQLYWWVGDGSNTELLQSYANGIGPKAGNYTLTRPGAGAFYLGNDADATLYYWSHTNIPTEKAMLMSYRTHDFLYEDADIIWVSPFSSYASQMGDLSNDNTNYVVGTEATSYITHFNSLIVTVDTGDDGNIYIQIGGQECNTEAQVTIGRKTNADVHRLTVSAAGDGIVSLIPACEYYKEGDVITLVPTANGQPSYFTGWVGEYADYVQDNGNGTYSVTMQNADMDLTAVFGVLEKVKGVFSVDATCGDSKAMTMIFTREQGLPVRYDVYFSEAANRQGFEDVINQKMPNTPVFEWSVPMPSKPDDEDWYVRPDDYEAKLVLTDLYNDVTTYDVKFTVLYPSRVIIQRWNDILTMTNRDFNGGYDVVQVQWYANGEPVDGRGDHNFFYYAGDNQQLLFGVPYRADITRAEDLKTISTCDYIPYQHADTVIFKDDLYMTPRYAGNPRQVAVTTSLSGRYIVYDISGREVLTGWFGADYGSPDIVFPASALKGTYLVRFLPDGAKQIHKKWMVY